MSTHIHTTAVVAIHVKVDIEGDFVSPSDFQFEASRQAMAAIDAALATSGSNTAISVESAETLVDEAVLESWFQR